MKSFKDYTPKSEKSTRAGTSQTVFNEDGIEELVKQIAGVYEGKTNAQMLSGIIAEATNAKKNGRLSNEQIDEFYSQFAPMLNDFQKKKLDEIVRRLKEL